MANRIPTSPACIECFAGGRGVQLADGDQVSSLGTRRITSDLGRLAADAVAPSGNWSTHSSFVPQPTFFPGRRTKPKHQPIEREPGTYGSTCRRPGRVFDRRPPDDRVRSIESTRKRRTAPRGKCLSTRCPTAPPDTSPRGSEARPPVRWPQEPASRSSASPGPGPKTSANPPPPPPDAPPPAATASTRAVPANGQRCGNRPAVRRTPATPPTKTTIPTIAQTDFRNMAGTFTKTS